MKRGIVIENKNYHMIMGLISLVAIVGIVVIGLGFKNTSVVGKVALLDLLGGEETLPSSKAAIALGDLIDLGALASTSGSPTDDTGYVTIMQTFLKTSNQKDLSADVSLQCGLVTDTTVRSRGGEKDVSSTEGKISVRVKGTNTKTGEVRYFEPSETGTAPDRGPRVVTYCSRLQQLEAKFAGLNCVADLTTGVVTCTDPEELRLLLETLNANAFNYLLADVSPGVWKIEVQTRAEADVLLGGSGFGSANAKAFIGLGSTLIEELRLIKDAKLEPIIEL